VQSRPSSELTELVGYYDQFFFDDDDDDDSEDYYNSEEHHQQQQQQQQPIDLYVCPSNLHVAMVLESFRSRGNNHNNGNNNIVVGAQNCNPSGGCGPYTGEMSADQMMDLGIHAVLIGHSERRRQYDSGCGGDGGESDQMLAAKLEYCLLAGMPLCVFCVGESLSVRRRGTGAVAEEVCDRQLRAIIPHLRMLEDKSRIVIAYEPVWAIGTGVSATPDQAQNTHRAIRDWIRSTVDDESANQIRIQYGGSVSSASVASEMMNDCPDVDGFLVGGSSLTPEIANIVTAVAESTK